MHSEIVLSRSSILFSSDIEYRLTLPLALDEKQYFEFAWKLLHEFLPNEARREQLLTNIKGMSSNHVMLEGLMNFRKDQKDLLYYVEGISKIEESLGVESQSDNDESVPFHFGINSDFSNFYRLRNIQYKSKIFSEGPGAADIKQPLLIFRQGTKIEKLFLGMEFFEGHYFYFVGFAPRITRALLIQADKEQVVIKMKVEQCRNRLKFPDKFNNYPAKLNKLLSNFFAFDLEKDLKHRLTE